MRDYTDRSVDDTILARARGNLFDDDERLGRISRSNITLLMVHKRYASRTTAANHFQMFTDSRWSKSTREQQETKVIRDNTDFPW